MHHLGNSRDRCNDCIPVARNSFPSVCVFNCSPELIIAKSSFVGGRQALLRTRHVSSEDDNFAFRRDIQFQYCLLAASPFRGASPIRPQKCPSPTIIAGLTFSQYDFIRVLRFQCRLASVLGIAVAAKTTKQKNASQRELHAAKALQSFPHVYTL